MSRKNAREDSFRIIFQSLINKLNADEFLDDYFNAVKKPLGDGEELFINDPTEADNEYVKNIVDGVLKNVDELDRIISENLVGWDVRRLSKVSVAAMRLALYEIIYIEDIPTKVSINEAIEIAKKYDGVECGAFVNGALGNAVLKLDK